MRPHDDDRADPTSLPDSIAGRPRLRWWYLLFLVQFVAVLWPPFYNRASPHWMGIPFFYWYQLLWVILGGLCTAVVYWATRRRGAGS